jgi:hypothetical protein
MSFYVVIVWQAVFEKSDVCFDLMKTKDCGVL